MKPENAAFQETRRIAIGTAILCAAMLIVFLVIGQMNWQTALGGLIGWALAVGNFFVMALDVQRLMDAIDPQDEGAVKRAKAKMRLSYNRRMIALVLLLAGAIMGLGVNWIAAILPLLFPPLIIKARQLFQNRKAKGSEL